MAGSAPATAMDKTSFATTCSLLSQYVKEKKGGLLQGLGGLAMAAAAGKGNSSFVVRCDPLLSVKCHTAMHE
jgi:jasmonate ZIM domain-containing protein